MISNHTSLTAPTGADPADLADRTSPDAFDRRRLEREAQALRQAFAGDPSVRLVVGLDLVIRRAAIRVREVWTALLHRTAAVPHRDHARATRS